MFLYNFDASDAGSNKYYEPIAQLKMVHILVYDSYVH